MEMQRAPTGRMHNVHDTFWRQDQVTILFQSSLPLYLGDGTLNPDPVQEVDIPKQLGKINEFFREKNVPVTLQLLKEVNLSHPMRSSTPQYAFENLLQGQKVQLPPGVYPFGFKKPIESPHGAIATTFISFFHIHSGFTQSGSGQTAMAYSDNEGKVSAHHDDRDHGHDHDHDHNGDKGPGSHLVRRVVNVLNENLDELFVNRGIPITVSAPAWLGGGTQNIPGGGGQGCPLTPPMPVENPICSNYSIQLQGLSSDLLPMTGKGVSVFILDAFPERGIIARAAQDAGMSNPLLSQVNAATTFDYDFMSGVQEMQVMARTQNAFVGKDVYGNHYPTLIPDHGLFVAGIVSDLAPDASITCIRVLDDLCVGDLQTISQALWSIYNQKATPQGSLFTTPVVINLSLVIPTPAEASSEGLTTPGATFNDIWANVGQPLLALSQLNVVIPSSAGNEADPREMPPNTPIPGALFPAAFGNPPLVSYPDEIIIDGVIPVGAIDLSGNPTSYSCFPGSNGVATYGGEVPRVTEPPVANPSVNSDDLDKMIRGIYSSVEFPPLSDVATNPPEQYYTATNESAWAYWVGTSFATPIITAVVARVLEANPTWSSNQVHQAVLAQASSRVTWSNLDPNTCDVGSGPYTGSALPASQPCYPSE